MNDNRRILKILAMCLAVVIAIMCLAVSVACWLIKWGEQERDRSDTMQYYLDQRGGGIQ